MLVVLRKDRLKQGEFHLFVPTWFPLSFEQ